MKVKIKFIDEVGRSTMGEEQGYRKYFCESEGKLLSIGKKLEPYYPFTVGVILEINKFREHVYGSQWTKMRSYHLMVGGETVMSFRGSTWRVHPQECPVEESGGKISFPDGTIIDAPEWWAIGKNLISVEQTKP